MYQPVDPRFMFLDDTADRMKLIDRMETVRQELGQIVASLPEIRQYEPIYDGWSAAAIIGYLNLTDRLALWQIKLALLGLRFRPPANRRFDSSIARLYQRRVVAASVADAQRNLKTLSAFILQLPVDRFTREVYSPTERRLLTVEQAVQVYFLFRWQNRLDLLRSGGHQPAAADSDAGPQTGISSN